MSWVDEAKAVIQKQTMVRLNILTSEPVLEGREKARRAKSRDIAICITTIHHLFVFSTSTKGLQSGLISQGRYRRLVHRAMSALPIPRRLNMITEMLFTTK